MLTFSVAEIAAHCNGAPWLIPMSSRTRTECQRNWQAALALNATDERRGQKSPCHTHKQTDRHTHTKRPYAAGPYYMHISFTTTTATQDRPALGADLASLREATLSVLNE